MIRTTMNATNADCCLQLLKNLKIVTLKSQYIFSFYYCIRSKNRDLYESNSENYNINTRL